MLELRHNTEQIVRVGVLLEYTRNTPINPIQGAALNWFWWRYLIKSDGTVIDIISHTWNDIPNCDGLYFLTLTEVDVNQLGFLILYIHDETGLGKPIFMEFNVINKNSYDSKYNVNDLPVVYSESQHAQEG